MRIRLALLFALSLAILTTACGGGGGNTTISGGGSTGGGTTGGGGTGTTNNTAQLIVDAGPLGLLQANQADQNLAFTTISVCVPGTTTCQTIDHVQVDTGSEGLRIPAGVLNTSLPQQTSGGNPVLECVAFSDGSFIWGPLATADIQIAGEVAHSVPIQLASASAPTAAASNNGCSPDQTGQITTVAELGANAILGLGLFRQDCGSGCVNNANNDVYFSCSTISCTPIAQSLTAQSQNPVWMFATDNNGVMIQLPSIPAAGLSSATGALIFGIGTQADNAVGSATLLQPDTGSGEFGARFNNVVYNDENPPQLLGHGSSFIDSGSNGIFFLDSQTLVNSGFQIPDCSDVQGFYCPLSTQQLTVDLFAESSSTGVIVGSPRTVQFSVANADNLLLPNIAATNDLGGPFPDGFDFGLPFFFGKTIFFGIEKQSTPLGQGPIYAF